MCYGSSVTRTAMMLMFPLGSVNLVYTTPKGSGLVWDRGLNNDMGEARGELWLTEYRKNPYTHALNNNNLSKN